MSIRKQKIGEPDIFADQMDVCGMDYNFMIREIMGSIRVYHNAAPMALLTFYAIIAPLGRHIGRTMMS